ncbi:MAG TPA: hypothetical protein VFB45_15045 [Pseudolabrys sp.]|nr:hypothetical protein [Pseudolabrys sp.]
MRDSERLLEQARKCFADASTCADPAQMRILADRGAEFLAQAQEAAGREKKGDNGH